MEVELTPIVNNQGDMELLQQRWQRLEQQRTNVNFFISWHWIGTWLSVVKPRSAFLVSVTESSVTKGLAVVVINKTSFGTSSIWLNKTGNEKLDQVWIEYNDILIQKGCEESVVRHAFISHLYKTFTGISTELHVDMSTPINVDDMGAFYNDVKFNAVGYIKYLTKAESKGLLQDFSKNTRKQIQRSEKLLRETGELVLSQCAAENKQEALAKMARLHQMQWRETEWGSGFDNFVFVQFHQQLIQLNESVVLQLSWHDQELAYGYYFCFQEKVYFYLSAIKKFDDNRIKVGLLFHYLAMEYFAQLGYQEYDFLAGDARYKRSLSDHEYILYSYRFSKRNCFTKSKRILRRCKSFTNRVWP